MDRTLCMLRSGRERSKYFRTFSLHCIRAFTEKEADVINVIEN